MLTRDHQPDHREHAVEGDQPALAVQRRPGGRRRSRPPTQASPRAPQVGHLQPVHQQVVAVQREERVEVEQGVEVPDEGELEAPRRRSGTAKPDQRRRRRPAPGRRPARRPWSAAGPGGRPSTRRWCPRTPTGCRSRPGNRPPAPADRRAWWPARGRARGRRAPPGCRPSSTAAPAAYEPPVRNTDCSPVHQLQPNAARPSTATSAEQAAAGPGEQQPAAGPVEAGRPAGPRWPAPSAGPGRRRAAPCPSRSGHGRRRTRCSGRTRRPAALPASGCRRGRPRPGGPDPGRAGR